MKESASANDCPVCSESNFKIKYRDICGVDNKRYDYITCSTCGYETVTPLPSAGELADFYSTAHKSRTKANIYEHTNTHDFIETNKSVIEDNLAILSFVEPYTTTSHKRLLDVGCGHGFMCYAAKLREYEAVGVDLDTDAQKLGARHLGVELINGTIQDVDRHDFDIVTEVMTLEHVREPGTHIIQIKDRLRDDGLYIGSVPNAGGFYAHLCGKKWYHLIPPEHLNYFNSTTLRQFLRSAGFEVLYMGTIPLYAAPTICFGVRGWLNELIASQKRVWLKNILMQLYRVLTLVKRHMLYKPLNFVIIALALSGNGIFWIARKTPVV